MSSEGTAHAPAALTIEVYTTPGRPIVSATVPGGPGDLPTWSPSSATLIHGDHDAILVDALATNDQVDDLADWIDTKGRRLSRIYITHGHGDHWLGLARLIQRFPGATGLATAEVLARVEFEAGLGMAGYWEGIFPGEPPYALAFREISRRAEWQLDDEHGHSIDDRRADDRLMAGEPPIILLDFLELQQLTGPHHLKPATC